MTLSTCMLEQDVWASWPCGLQIDEDPNLHRANLSTHHPEYCQQPTLVQIGAPCACLEVFSS